MPLGISIQVLFWRIASCSDCSSKEKALNLCPRRLPLFLFCYIPVHVQGGGQYFSLARFRFQGKMTLRLWPSVLFVLVTVQYTGEKTNRSSSNETVGLPRYKRSCVSYTFSRFRSSHKISILFKQTDMGLYVPIYGVPNEASRGT